MDNTEGAVLLANGRLKNAVVRGNAHLTIVSCLWRTCSLWKAGGCGLQ